MEINYDNCPMLLYTSFTKDDTPDELPIEIVSQAQHDYLSKYIGFNSIFSTISVRNSMLGKNSNTHFCLSDDILSKIEYDDSFRDRYFKSFFSNFKNTKNGVIIFKECAQYVYLLLGERDTRLLKKREGRYIAAALLCNNNFIGFEEGIILNNNGIEVLPTGFYESGMDVGGFISFVLITLSYAGNREHPIMNTSGQEKIYKLL